MVSVMAQASIYMALVHCTCTHCTSCNVHIHVHVHTHLYTRIHDMHASSLHVKVSVAEEQHYNYVHGM